MVITVDEWTVTDPKDDSFEGTVRFVPSTDLLVVAKIGENKIVFKPFISKSTQQSSSIQTVFDSMYHILIPERHKFLVVFDSKLDVIAYYSLSKFIGCPKDPNVISCSPSLMYEDVECKKGYYWNPVAKRCQCNQGFYLNTTTNLCEACNCPGQFQQCFFSATDCNSEPYFQVQIKGKDSAVDSVCLTQGANKKKYLLAWDG